MAEFLSKYLYITLLFTKFVHKFLNFTIYICISSYENNSLNMFLVFTVKKELFPTGILYFFV